MKKSKPKKIARIIVKILFGFILFCILSFVLMDLWDKKDLFIPFETALNNVQTKNPDLRYLPEELLSHEDISGYYTYPAYEISEIFPPFTILYLFPDGTYLAMETYGGRKEKGIWELKSGFFSIQEVLS